MKNKMSFIVGKKEIPNKYSKQKHFEQKLMCVVNLTTPKAVCVELSFDKDHIQLDKEENKKLIDAISAALKRPRKT